MNPKQMTNEELVEKISVVHRGGLKSIDQLRALEKDFKQEILNRMKRKA